MGSIQIAYFALPEETVRFVSEYATNASLSLVIKIPNEGGGIETHVLPEPEAILPRRPSEILVVPKGNFPSDERPISYHADWFLFQVGMFDGATLRESFAGVKTTNSRVFTLWQDLAKEFRKQMKNGLWCINPQTGAYGYYNVRYTSGAKEKEKQGIKLAAIAGWNYYQVEKPQSEATCSSDVS